MHPRLAAIPSPAGQPFPASLWGSIGYFSYDAAHCIERLPVTTLNDIDMPIMENFECMGDVRGKGLMVAVELVKDRETKEPATEWRSRIIKESFEKGLLLLGCGENSIRFSPSLTVTANEVDTCLSIFEESVKEVAG